jgi:hypothetical protein
MSEDARRGSGWVTLSVLFFVVAMLYGWHLLTASPEPDEAAYPTCQSRTIKAGDDLPTSMVEVDVFNGGDREGLAGTVSSALQERGFRQGAIANSESAIAPTDITILATDATDPRVELVKAQFKDADVRAPDYPTGSAVAVLVGDDFGELAPDAPRSIKATTDVTVCF